VESDEREARPGDNRSLLTELLTAGREAHPTAGGSLPDELILSDREDQPVRKRISSTGKVDILKKNQRAEEDKKKQTKKERTNVVEWLSEVIVAIVAGCGLRVAGGGVAEQMENGTKK
jgi:hypothetical protein